jgi:hypothetical protein
MKQLEIKPAIGLGDIKFGMTRDQVKKILGEPAEIEQLSYSDSDEDLTESWHYDDQDLSAGFDEDEDWRLVTLAISSQEYDISGKKLIGLNQEQLLAALAALKINDLETEDCSDDENPDSLLISSEEMGISFWLEDGMVSEIQWGPVITEEETILWPE